MDRDSLHTRTFAGDERFQPEQYHYWREFQYLKFAICYTRNYRDHISAWLTRAAILRAVTSSTSIAGWAIWHQYGFVWACLIAATQVADVLLRVLPYEKRRRSLSGWCNSLNRLMVIAQRDVESIFAGYCDVVAIAEMTHKLRDKMQKLEEKHAPQGLPLKKSLYAAAEAEMVQFMESRYSIEEV